PTATLLPYTTLFRSICETAAQHRASDPSRKGAKKHFRSTAQTCSSSSTGSLPPCLKSVPVVSDELNKPDWFTAENLLHVSSHVCSFALAIQPLEIKESVRVPRRHARR